jgi:phasin family protein
MYMNADELREISEAIDIVAARRKCCSRRKCCRRGPSTLPAKVLRPSFVDIARRNVDTSFDLAKSLAGAKNLTDIVELLAAYWRKQFDALTAQAKEVCTLSTKVTADTAAPIKTQMARRG